MLISPSFYEGFGMPALEAMACGTVPIVSNRSSLPEVVGDAGPLINPDDPASIASAIQSLLHDEAARQQFRERGIQRAKGFTWAESARIARRVYNSLL